MGQHSTNIRHIPRHTWINQKLKTETKMKKLFSFLPFLALALFTVLDFTFGGGGLAGMAIATAPLAVPEDIKAKAKQLLQLLTGEETPEGIAKAVETVGIQSNEVSAVLEFAKTLKEKNTNVAPNIITNPIGSKKYSGVPTEELAMSYDMMKSAGVKIPDELAQELVGRHESEDAKSMHREATKSFGNFRQKTSAKANEISQSTLANYGDEWVAQSWLNTVWERVRLGSNILNEIPTQIIPQGNESVEIPLESGDLTFYKVPQASDAGSAQVAPTIPTSRMGTDKKTLSVGKMAARSVYTGELEEDSIIAYASRLQAQAIVAFQEHMESLFLDGDTATGATTNINHIGGTPASTDVYLISDGARKNALATAGNKRSGTTLAAADFLATMKLLGKNGVDITKLKFILDAGTYFNALGLTEVKTVDTFGNDATVRTGELRMLYGVGLQPTAQVARLGGGLTNADGKVDQTTPANNTKGQILIVRPDQWRMALKRAMRIEYTRFANADASEFVIHTRAGFGARGSTGAAAITYGLTV